MMVDIYRKEKEEEKLHKIPLHITDTTLRDAHQSLWATRIRTDDILNIIDVIDKVGYYSLEVWGGATFDVCLRFLRENPWERLRQIKAKVTNTPLQMLLRGQNLVGYRNYADDVVDRFVALACEYGIDIFRVFDALNDTRNLEAAVKAVKKYGGHAQGTLCYTISPVHTISKYVEYAKEQMAIGIDSICIKDMAGILSPLQAEKLVSALIKETGLHVQMHCHASSGMANSAYVEGVRAGAGAIDCAISSVAGFSSQPPVETLAAIFSETHYSADLNFEALEKVADYFLDLAPKRRQSSAFQPVIDPAILIHQIPGGMISNFRSQLETQNALEKLPEVLKEVTRIRKDLGWPPLVTPTSQIVGAQAVMNIISGERYKIIPNEVKNYVKGMYGRPPAPIDKKLIKMILGGEKAIEHRPADDIPAMLPHATEGVDPKLIECEEDIISYCVLPEPALEYFKWRALPQDQRPEIPADAETKKAASLQAPEPKLAPNQNGASPDQLLSASDYDNIKDILSSVKSIAIDEISIRKGDMQVTLRTNGTNSVDNIVAEKIDCESSETLKKNKIEKTKSELPEAFPKKITVKDASQTINAPLVGIFYSTLGPGRAPFVKVGDVVKYGDPVCVVEAMKLFNEIKAPRACKIVEFLVKDGYPVSKNQPLIAIEEI